MSAIDELTVYPFVQSLGWTLLHFLWQGSLIAAAFATVNAFLLERGPNVRYLAASIAMFTMAACVAVTFHTLYSPSVSPGLKAAPTPFPTTSQLPVLEGNLQGQSSLPLDPNLLGATGGQSSSTQAVAAIATNRIQESLRSLLPWIVGCWVAGVIVLSIRLLGGWTYARILVRSHSRGASEEWCDKVNELRRKLGIERKVRLLETAAVEVPLVLGWLRPVLLLPVTAFTGLSPDQIEAILIHELAHIRRHDYLVNLVQTVAEILLFYHPAVWWISKRMRIEREYCCDDVASRSKDTMTYVAALGELEKRRGAALNPAVAAAGGSLLERIRRLCNVSTSHSSARRPGLISFVAVAVFLVVTSHTCNQLGKNGAADSFSAAKTKVAGGAQFTAYSEDEADPDWSPDGEWIAFYSTQSGNSDIWIKPAAGGEAIQITHHGAADRVPRWSPDGTKLLFASDRNEALNLWTISPFDGEETLTQITYDILAFEGQGSWSPDGTEIVYASERDGNYDLWIVSVEDGSERQLTSHPRYEMAADWSPDGKWIVFNAAPSSPGSSDLWIIPAEGGTARQLTDLQNYAPSWSPDGKWIAFCSEGARARGGPQYTAGNWDIWLLPSSGGTPFKLIDAAKQDAAGARWSPEGTKIAYNQRVRWGGDRHVGDHNIWIADVSQMKAVAEKKSHQRIAGEVTVDGKSGVDVLVDLTDRTGAKRHTATTSEDGRYQAWVNPGSYVVSVEGMEGADPIEVTLKPGDQIEDIDFAVKRIRPPGERILAEVRTQLEELDWSGTHTELQAEIFELLKGRSPEELRKARQVLRALLEEPD